MTRSLEAGSLGILADHALGDITARYLRDPSGQVGLLLIPTARLGDLAERREILGGGPEYRAQDLAAHGLYGLVQAKVMEDDYARGFASGLSMRGATALKFKSQRRQEDGAFLRIETLLEAGSLEFGHELAWRKGAPYAESSSSVRNLGLLTVHLEMLSSFCLEGITPFAADDAPGRLHLHRFRSFWSAEGRLESRPLEELHLERSWSGSSSVSERFGQTGSMAARKFHPTALVEDREAGVCWGAQIHWPGSWQVELLRKGDTVSLSGGLADREAGHWIKRLEPGERMEAPKAVLTVAAGGVDEACERLVAAQEEACGGQPAIEAGLPLIANEWCTSWGHPTHASVTALAARLATTPVKYLVIDAGWYAAEGGDFFNGHGDWDLNRESFPEGLARTASALREAGLVPGLWFEMETAARKSRAFQRGEHFLKLDGRPLVSGDRRFWDLRDPAALEFLADKVIAVLRDNGFGYLKVDYNEAYGIGCDGAESPGEGGRLQAQAVLDFFGRIRSELPGLVIENCASGGHRLEPALLSLCAMGSFSDAHEPREIPIIAAQWHRLMPPRQSQVWAVLRKEDDERRLIYSLAAGFLGRLCLSGDLMELGAGPWSLLNRALGFYGRVAPIIRDGSSRIHGLRGESWRHPRGWQALARASRDGKEMLVVAHAFGDPPSSPSLALPGGDWRVSESLCEGPRAPEIKSGRLLLPIEPEFSACAVHLRRP